MDFDDIIKMIPPEVFASKDSQRDITTEKRNSQAIEEGIERTSNETIQESINKPALTLALFGWDLCGDKSAGLASCKACFRRLGLWMYLPKEDGSSSIYPKLDVISEHLDYCPWVDPKSQSGSEKKPNEGAHVGPPSGWELLQQVLRNVHRRRTWSAVSEAPTSLSQDEVSNPGDLDVEDRKAKDREWWAKLRRVRQALQVKGPKKQKNSS